MRKTARLLVLFLVAGISVPLAVSAGAMELKSPAFSGDNPIPQSFTCQGQNVSPPLAWTGVPEKTKSLALIVEDPDAPRGIWVHWVLYNLPGDVRSLPSGIPALPALEKGGTQGKNDFGRIGYGGPCPPPGKPHRYFFILYALDAPLELAPGAARHDLLQAMKGHVLSEAKLMGTFGR